MGSSLIINININLTQRRSFKRCFDLLESKEMMTLDSHFEHLFLKKDLTHRGLGLIRCQTHKRLDLTHEPKKIGSGRVLNSRTLGPLA
jgi:hypothetical protein